MNNSPENEKQINETEEFSTVFSDPTVHKNAADNKKKSKRLTIVISAFLAVAILIGGTFGIIKLIPEKETEEPDNSTFEEIEVLALDADTLTSVNITNESGSYKIYSVKEKSEDTSSSSSRVINWYVEGIDKDLISTDSTVSIVSSLSNITALKEITQKSLADCGLSEPAATAVLTDENGKQTKILLGDQSPDNSGCYFKIEDSEKIYLVDVSVTYVFNQGVLDLGDSSDMGAFPLSDSMTDFTGSDGLLGKFEKLTITGKNFPVPVVIEENSNEKLNQLVGYVTTSPTNHIADGTDDIFNAFKNGIAVSGTYSFDKSAAMLQKFGLDNPDFTATMEIMGVTHTFKFKLQEDGYYAAVCDTVKLIQKINATTIPFVEQTTKDFYSSWVCLVSIDDIDSLVINTPEKSHTFEFTDVEDEDSDVSFTVKYNGKDFDTETLQDFYMGLISIPCNDFTIDEVALESDYSFTFNFRSEIGGKNVIDFVRVSETRYQYYSDGVAMGKVTSSELKKVINSLEKITAES